MRVHAWRLYWWWRLQGITVVTRIMKTGGKEAEHSGDK